MRLTLPKRVLIEVFCVIFLLGVAIGVSAGLDRGKDLTNQKWEQKDVLEGGTLHYMVVDAKMSPGVIQGYCDKHPSFAWIFELMKEA